MAYKAIKNFVQNGNAYRPGDKLKDKDFEPRLLRAKKIEAIPAKAAKTEKPAEEEKPVVVTPEPVLLVEEPVEVEVEVETEQEETETDEVEVADGPVEEAAEDEVPADSDEQDADDTEPGVIEPDTEGTDLDAVVGQEDTGE